MREGLQNELNLRLANLKDEEPRECLEIFGRLEQKVGNDSKETKRIKEILEFKRVQLQLPCEYGYKTTAFSGLPLYAIRHRAVKANQCVYKTAEVGR